MSWIDVNDKLPEYTTQASGIPFVIVIVCSNGVVGEGMYCDGIWEIMGIKNVPVSHWMYYPEPPRNCET